VTFVGLIEIEIAADAVTVEALPAAVTPAHPVSVTTTASTRTNRTTVVPRERSILPHSVAPLKGIFTETSLEDAVGPVRSL